MTRKHSSLIAGSPLPTLLCAAVLFGHAEAAGPRSPATTDRRASSSQVGRAVPPRQHSSRRRWSKGKTPNRLGNQTNSPPKVTPYLARPERTALHQTDSQDQDSAGVASQTDRAVVRPAAASEDAPPARSTLAPLQAVLKSARQTGKSRFPAPAADLRKSHENPNRLRDSRQLPQSEPTASNEEADGDGNADEHLPTVAAPEAKSGKRQQGSAAPPEKLELQPKRSDNKVACGTGDQRVSAKKKDVAPNDGLKDSSDSSQDAPWAPIVAPQMPLESVAQQPLSPVEQQDQDHQLDPVGARKVTPELAEAHCVLRLFSTLGMTPAQADEQAELRTAEAKNASHAPTLAESTPPLPIAARPKTLAKTERRGENIAAAKSGRNSEWQPAEPRSAFGPASKTAATAPQAAHAAIKEPKVGDRTTGQPAAEPSTDKPSHERVVTTAVKAGGVPVEIRVGAARPTQPAAKPAPQTPAPTTLAEASGGRPITHRVFDRRTGDDGKSNPPSSAAQTALIPPPADVREPASPTAPSRADTKLDPPKPTGRAVRSRLRRAIDSLVGEPAGISRPDRKLSQPEAPAQDLTASKPEASDKTQRPIRQRPPEIAHQLQTVTKNTGRPRGAKAGAQDRSDSKGPSELVAKATTKPTPEITPVTPDLPHANETASVSRPEVIVPQRATRKRPTFRVIGDEDRTHPAGGPKLRPGTGAAQIVAVPGGPLPARPGLLRQLPRTSAVPQQIRERPYNSHPTLPTSAVVTRPGRPGKEVRLAVKTSYPMQAPGRVMRISVGNREICDVVQHSPYGLALVGKQEGRTEVSVWLEGESAAQVYRIVVGRGGGPPENEQRLQQLVADLFPNSAVSITQRNGNVHVDGHAKNRQEAIQILSVVRSVKLVPVIDNLEVQRRWR